MESNGDVTNCLQAPITVLKSVPILKLELSANEQETELVLRIILKQCHQGANAHLLFHLLPMTSGTDSTISFLH
jgi:hypothetical protein